MQTNLYAIMLSRVKTRKKCQNLFKNTKWNTFVSKLKQEKFKLQSIKQPNCLYVFQDFFFQIFPPHATVSICPKLTILQYVRAAWF